jgi:hypothetical protein
VCVAWAGGAFGFGCMHATWPGVRPRGDSVTPHQTLVCMCSAVSTPPRSHTGLCRSADAAPRRTSSEPNTCTSLSAGPPPLLAAPARLTRLRLPRVAGLMSTLKVRPKLTSRNASSRKKYRMSCVWVWRTGDRVCMQQARACACMRVCHTASGGA